MKIAYFDIETDNLIPKLTTFHVGVVKSDGHHRVHLDPQSFVDDLYDHDVIVGHNVLAFDMPAMAMLGYPIDNKIVYDTCVMSRLLWPDRNTHPAGGSSLKKWGEHLRMPKGDHTDFSMLSNEMIEY